MNARVALCAHWRSNAGISVPNAPIRFPYLLPNMVGASLALMGLPLVFLFLKETKHLHNGEGASR